MTDSPVEDPGDAARWWEAYCLAENDEADALRRRADSGDDHARRQLAHWLARRGQVDELRRRADAGDEHARQILAASLNG